MAARAKAQTGIDLKTFDLTTVSKAKTAKEAWAALAAVSKAKSNAKRLRLKGQLTALVKEGGEPLTKYVHRATDKQDQLLAADYKVSDEEVVMSVLAGLPKEYDTVVAVLELSDSALMLDDLLAKLLQAEQRYTRTDQGEEHAFLGRVLS